MKRYNPRLLSILGLLLIATLVASCGATPTATPVPVPPTATKAPAAAPTTAPAAPTAAPAAAATKAPAAPTAAPAATTAPAALTKVRVGWTVAPHMGMVGVALKKGWFKEAGLDVELSSFDSGGPLFEAMNAAKLDIGLSGSVPPMSAAVAGAPPVYFIGSHSISTDLFTIIARKSIKSPADLKGKTCLTTKGSVNHYFLDLMLDKFGMSEKDITLVHMEQSDAVAAFIANQGECASLGTAFFPQVLTKSPDTQILFTGKMLGQEPGKVMKTQLIEVSTAKKDWADKNPDVVTKFLDVLYNRAHKYFNDPATKMAARQELSDWLKATVNVNQSVADLGAMLDPAIYPTCAEQAKYFTDGTYKVTLDSQAQYLVDSGRIKSVPDFAVWGNPKFVQGCAK